MVVLFIEGSTSEFTVYLDPPIVSPKWIRLYNATMGIPSSLFPPEEVYITCDLIDSESVRHTTSSGEVIRSDVLAIISKPKNNQLAFHGVMKPKILTKSLNHVYSIRFRVEYSKGKLVPFPPEKVKLELEIC